MERHVQHAKLLIASVTAVFVWPAARALEPRAIADALLATEDVVTVRIGLSGAVSVFRADIEEPTSEGALAAARGIATGVASRLGVGVDVVGVTLMTDGREEVVRVGRPDGPPPAPGQR